MNIKYDYIEISNFLSFGKKVQRVDLDIDGTTLIIGENKDNGKEGMSRNGVGKSTIFQAICFALFGDGFTNIRKDDFVNIRNKKKLMVKLSFEIDGAKYIILRGRKPNVLTITKDGEPFTLATVKNEDEAIVELLGYDINIFLNTQMLTNNITNFVYMKGAEQKKFIENIFNIDILSQRATSIKASNKENDIEIRLEEQALTNIENNNNMNSRNMTSLTTNSESWESERITGIKEYQGELKVLKEYDVQSNLILNIDKVKLDESLKEVSNNITTLEEDIRSVLHHTNNLNNEHTQLLAGNCPYCKQEYLNQDKIDEVEGLLATNESYLNDIQPTLMKAIQSENDLGRLLATFTDFNPDLLSDIDCNNIINRINNLEDKINDLTTDTINPYTDQIELLSESIQEVDKVVLHGLKDLQDHYKFMVKLLTDSKSYLRKSIVNQYVPIVNTYVNDYLEDLESPNKFILNDDLSMDIDYMGRKISFGNLSTGEKIRMSFAISMAFNDFLAMTGSSSNVLFIDELFDAGIDASGYYNILNMLKRKEKITFIISHRDDIITEVDHVITVTKENGFSNLSFGYMNKL